jgi:hypothetical protein
VHYQTDKYGRTIFVQKWNTNSLSRTEFIDGKCIEIQNLNRKGEITLDTPRSLPLSSIVNLAQWGHLMSVGDKDLNPLISKTLNSIRPQLQGALDVQRALAKKKLIKGKIVKEQEDENRDELLKHTSKILQQTLLKQEKLVREELRSKLMEEKEKEFPSSSSQKAEGQLVEQILQHTRNVNGEKGKEKEVEEKFSLYFSNASESLSDESMRALPTTMRDIETEEKNDFLSNSEGESGSEKPFLLTADQPFIFSEEEKSISTAKKTVWQRVISKRNVLV